MNERRTLLESFWRSVALVVAAVCILSSSPMAYLMRLVLDDPGLQLIFFPATGVIVAALVIRFIVRTINWRDDPHFARLPDESP